MSDKWFINKKVSVDVPVMIKSAGFQDSDKASCLNNFRLLNDENEIIFDGRCESDSSFAPLEEYGVYNNCTNIAYWDARSGDFQTML
jgi:hypothetical protein